MTTSRVLEEWLKTPDGACCKIVGTITPVPEIHGPGAGIAIRKGETDLVNKFNAAIDGYPRQRQIPGNQQQVLPVRRLRRRFLIRIAMRWRGRRSSSPPGGTEARGNRASRCRAPGRCSAGVREGWLDEIAYGVLVTVTLALATLPFGLVIGFFVALAKQSDEASLRLAGNIYTTIFRGLPELLTLFLVYFGVQIMLQKLLQLFQPDATIEINSFVSGMIALCAVFSSYASEVFLSAFKAIPRGQYEGGYSIGLSSGQTMRLVVLPQLIRDCPAGPRQSVADPAQGYFAGVGRRSCGHHSRVHDRRARHQARFPVLRLRRPCLSGAGDPFVLRLSMRSSARSNRQEVRS